MSDDSNSQSEPDESAASSSSRRDFVKRSIVAGGAVWAAPSVLSMGSKALADVGNGSAGGFGDCNNLFKFKYEYDKGEFSCPSGNATTDDFGNVTYQGFPFCEPPEGWNDTGVSCTSGKSIPGVGDISVQSFTTDEKLGLRFTLPDGCDILAYSVKAGSDDSAAEPCVSSPSNVENNVIEVVHPEKDVSYAAFVICC